MAASRGPAELEVAVLRYLRKRGYKSAEQALRTEAALPEHMAVAPPQTGVPAGANAGPDLLDPQVTNQILFYSCEESNPRRYFASYQALRDWVHRSLDLYKNELARVLYPVLVHCFLDLVEKDELPLARELLAAFREEHERLHGAELTRLQGLGSPEHLKTNETAQLFRKNRFCLKLCSYSFDLLLRFLHGNDFMLLLSVLNEHVSFKVNPGKPDQLTEEGEEDPGVITGDEARTRAMNLKEGRWGVLEDSLERVVALEQAKAKEEAEAAAAPAAKKAKKEPGKGAADKEHPAAAGVVSTMVPIPKLPEKTEQELLSELRRRVTLTSTALPSVCFYTFHHTNHLLNCTTVSSDCRLVVGGFSNSSIRIWDMDRAADDNEASGATAGEEARAQKDGDRTRKASSLSLAALSTTRLCGHAGPVYALDLTPDNEFLLSASADHTVRLWNLDLKANLVAYKSHHYPVWDVRCSPMGYYFASASHDRTARIWAMDQTDPLRILAGHLSDVDTVAWHPNSNYVATGSTDKTVRLWDVQTGECTRLFIGHHSTVYSLAFSPDGRSVASGAEDGTVMLWDLGSSQRLATLKGHQGPVWSMGYSGGGNVLASGGADCSVRLWDVNAMEAADQPASSSAAKGSAAAPAAAAAAAEPEAKPAVSKFGTCLKTLATKSTPVYTVKFTHRNLLLATGGRQ